MIFEDLVRKFLKLFPSRNEREIRRLHAEGEGHRRARGRVVGENRRRPAAPRPNRAGRRDSRPEKRSTTSSCDAFALDHARRRSARIGIAPLRRAADRRHGPASGQDRRDDAPAKARPSSPRCRAYLNALAGKGVHVVTVNDYLATPRRASGWAASTDSSASPSASIVHEHRRRRTRAAAYACDITYGTNNEFGFDYLRDNMKCRARATSVQQRPQLRDRRRSRLDPHRRSAARR
jgi:hypothetical protein